MSRQPVIPSDANDSVKEPNAESHGLLPSSPHKQRQDLFPKDAKDAKEDSPRPSKLSTTWRDYWKTPATIIALFLLGPYISLDHKYVPHVSILMFKTISLDNRYNSPGPSSIIGQTTDEWSRFYPAELCSGPFRISSDFSFERLFAAP
jgi:hypothetical protein